MNATATLSNITRLHNVAGDYPELQNVPGIEGYSWRSTMMPGTAIVHGTFGPDERFLMEHYNEAGFGAQRVIAVPFEPGHGLYTAALQNNEASLAIQEAVRAGTLQLFRPSMAADAWLAFQGRTFKDTISPSRLAADPWNSKKILRERAEAAGLGHLFLPNTTCSSREALEAAVQHYMSNGSAYVVKDPCGASSEGMQFCYRGEYPRYFMEHDWRSQNGAVVEAAAAQHLPYSLVYNLTDEGVEFLYSSLQMLAARPIGEMITLDDLRDADLRAHRGNMVAPYGHDIGPLHWESIYTAIQAVMPLMVLVRVTGVRGAICVDMGYINPMYSVVFEINARVSNSMYANAIRSAIASNGFANGQANVLIANCRVDPEITGFLAAAERLNSNPNTRLFDGTASGTSMYHTPLLRLDPEPGHMRKAGLISIGHSYEDVVQRFQAAEAVLKGQ